MADASHGATDGQGSRLSAAAWRWEGSESGSLRQRFCALPAAQPGHPGSPSCSGPSLDSMAALPAADPAIRRTSIGYRLPHDLARARSAWRRHLSQAPGLAIIGVPGGRRRAAAPPSPERPRTPPSQPPRQSARAATRRAAAQPAATVSPLHLAAWRGDVRRIEQLCQTDIDVNAITHDQATALYIAANLGHEAVVRELLRHPKIDPNRAQLNGWSPLHIAAAHNHGAVVRLLRMSQPVSPLGHTAIGIAKALGHAEAAEALRFSPSVFHRLMGPLSGASTARRRRATPGRSLSCCCDTQRQNAAAEHYKEE